MPEPVAEPISEPSAYPTDATALSRAADIGALEPGTAAELSAREEHAVSEAVKRWDLRAEEIKGQGLRLGRGYHGRLKQVYRHLIPKGASVLEVGSGRGDLLAAVEPKEGVGLDFSSRMVNLARETYPVETHPNLDFVHASADELDEQLEGPFDYVILSDLVNELRDVQRVLERVRRVCRPETRVIVNTYSRVWEPVLSLAGKLNLARPMVGQNWLTVHDVRNLLVLAGFEPLRTWQEVLLPTVLPGVNGLFNRFLAKVLPTNQLALANFIVARPAATPIAQRRASDAGEQPVVSVIVAARNESGNIQKILDRTPQDLGGGTELIFVEGNSSDDTWDMIQRKAEEYPDWGVGIKVMQQDGKGKGDAVRKGFAAATGGVLMILDADMTVPPEDLPRFYEAIRSGRGEYVNGVRLVYPMEDQAMRFFNLLGNKFFSAAFSFLLGQPIKDTLCGTKVMTKHHYEQVAAGRSYFGDFDPFGDFDLIFGAAKLNLKMIDLPIRYQARTYGDTNIDRWRSGVILLRMTLYAARRLKFV
ncbi:MAG: bifunctional class I SAM-dependent methyltransferase/glycosyltransferase family 2 protein [Planctomycetota bacterium]